MQKPDAPEPVGDLQNSKLDQMTLWAGAEGVHLEMKMVAPPGLDDQPASETPHEQVSGEPAGQLGLFGADGGAQEAGARDGAGVPTGAAVLGVVGRAWRRARSRRWSRVAGVCAAGVLVLCVLAGLFVHALLRERPAWWKSVGNDPETVRTADAVELGIQRVLAAERALGEDGSSDVWPVSVKDVDANAWLNHRLRKWLVNQGHGALWPERVREVQVHFADGLIHIGALVDDGEGGGARVLAASLQPQFREDGSLWMPAHRVSVGRLGVPASWVLESEGEGEVGGVDVPDRLSDLPQAGQMLSAFAGEVPVLSSSRIKLGDGRAVDLVGVEARNGRLYMECRTVWLGARDGRQASTR